MLVIQTHDWRNDRNFLAQKRSPIFESDLSKKDRDRAINDRTILHALPIGL